MEILYTRRVETWKFCPFCHSAEVDILPLEQDSVQHAHAQTPVQHKSLGGSQLSALISDVNKDWTHKDQDKDQSHKDKDKD